MKWTHFEALTVAALRSETAHTSQARRAQDELTAALDVPAYLRRNQGLQIERLRRLVAWHGERSDRHVVTSQRWVAPVVGHA